MNNYHLGIDAGSTTIKAVLIDGLGRICHSLYKRTQPSNEMPVVCKGHCLECGRCSFDTCTTLISEFLKKIGLTLDDMTSIAVTGSQIIDKTRDYIDYNFQISEVTAHVAGAFHFYPGCKAILDVGGQDSKAMVFNEEMGMWTSKMSGICAAGTGAFLDNIAQRLNISVEDMANMADLDSELEFSSICAVLASTSINKYKNRYPLNQIVGGACKAQARTIMSGVGDLLFGYKGNLIFQGGVAYNKVVAHHLEQITGNHIIIPEYHSVMGALGAAILAKNKTSLEKNKRFVSLPSFSDPNPRLKSIQMRVKQTSREFFGKSSKPVVWRNLYFPPEILNAFDTKIITLETYAAMFARNRQKIKHSLDIAAYKGYTSETCTFLRTLEGMELPKPDFVVSTTQPCQQGERIYRDLARQYNINDKYYSLQTPVVYDEKAIDHLANELEMAVNQIERAFGRKLDMDRLAEAFYYSNQAQKHSLRCTQLRAKNPPLIRGGAAVYFSLTFSQLWGKKEMVSILKQFSEELEGEAEEIKNQIRIEDTHRIMWLHFPPFYDTNLLDFIELKCNLPIIFEEVNYTGWEPLDQNDPYRSLAKRLMTIGLDPTFRAEGIKEYCSNHKFNGCILYNHGFGKCSMSDASFVKHLREQLNTISVPLLVLDGDCMDPTTDPCSTFTKVRAYAESLNLKKYGNIFGLLKQQDNQNKKNTTHKTILQKQDIGKRDDSVSAVAKLGNIG